uniref:Carbonic anhydrase n=1 Tax=Kalanchoe fedtschenkoi TaxID=63787 RepID=A0A7N0UC16_KALFE
MMKNSSSILVITLIILLISFFPTRSQSQAQETEDEREFDYTPGSDKGPERWGSLKEEWSACKEGDMQSPIDLASARVEVVSQLGKLKRKYWANSAVIKNRGHDIAVEWDGDAGWIEINGTSYRLKQSHWHSPSEHTVNGRRYAMEIHMVHQTDDHKLAVVGMFYRFGRPDPFLSELLKNVRLTNEHGVKEVDPNEIRMAGHRYYRYVGSLTVPPCTEGVIWTINKKVKTVSREQLASLREAVHDYAESNARPVQALNNRRIYSSSATQIATRVDSIIKD